MEILIPTLIPVLFIGFTVVIFRYARLMPKTCKYLGFSFFAVSTALLLYSLTLSNDINSTILSLACWFYSFISIVIGTIFLIGANQKNVAKTP